MDLLIISKILLKILPKVLLSRLAGRIANCEKTIVKRNLIWFAMKYFNINLTDALIVDPEKYVSFNDFFTRLLGADARPIEQKEKAIISPADGIITDAGKIKEDGVIQAKGKSFSLKSLTANTANEIYTDFAIIYLSPSNYHRVHMPLNGELKRMVYIPGKLFPVNEFARKKIDRIFAKNERLSCYFQTKIGEIAIIFIGAMLVGSIETQWHKVVTPNYYNKITHFDYHRSHLLFKKGSEIGLFHFGSTVIMLLPKNKVSWEKNVLKTVKMGEKIASYI